MMFVNLLDGQTSMSSRLIMNEKREGQMTLLIQTQVTGTTQGRTQVTFSPCKGYPAKQVTRISWFTKKQFTYYVWKPVSKGQLCLSVETVSVYFLLALKLPVLPLVIFWFMLSRLWTISDNKIKLNHPAESQVPIL